MTIRGRDDPPEPRKRPKRGVPMANGGIVYPRIYRETEGYPHFKGLVNVTCPHCQVQHIHYASVWKRVTEKDGMKYYFLTMQFRPKTEKVHWKQKIVEPSKPAYLRDHKAHDKFLQDKGPDPKERAAEYEYDRLMDLRRKQGYNV